MTEGVIVEWHKKVGDAVKPGDILAEVETDKATMELENYKKGTLLHIGIEKGQAVPVDALIAVIGEPGEDISAILSQAGAPKKESKETAAPAAETAKQENTTEEKTTAQPSVEAPAETGDGRIKASPLARKMAEDKGIDLKSLHGSGENGRIIRRDIEEYKETKVTAPAASSKAAVMAGGESYEDVPVSQMRKTIARRLSESKFSAPHFYLTVEINMDKALAARKQMNELSDVKISVNDIVVKATAMALRQHPAVNSSWLGDKIRINHHINIGVAIAIEDGLIVPVVRYADQKGISQISREVKDYAERAKNKKLQPEEFTGNTFTISNLGMFGIEEFTAIINPPDSCIMAVGASKETVVVQNGEFKVANVMKVTMSCDHRSVDGAVGSRFLQTFKDLLENPMKMLL